MLKRTYKEYVHLYVEQSTEQNTNVTLLILYITYSKLKQLLLYCTRYESPCFTCCKARSKLTYF